MSDTAIAGTSMTHAAEVPVQRERRRLRDVALKSPLVVKLIAFGVICHFTTAFGFAHKFPPHFISPLWPTGAVLFSVLVVAPVRHWWAYILAAYATSIANDIRIGFSISAALYIVAGLIEILIAAAGVRRFARGADAFRSFRTLVA